MFSILKNTLGKRKFENDPIMSAYERKKLHKTSRYTPVQTKIYEKDIWVNDACTLLSDIDSILKKEVYKFNATSSNPIIIDCGSNIGISIIYFKNLYPTSIIYGYEADPRLFGLLEKNIESFAFSDVILNQEAVWIDDNGVTFRQEGGHSGSVLKGEAESEMDVMVASIRLRDLLDDFDRIDLLKMDIEGAENKVLVDCERKVAKCDHIFVEYHSSDDEPQQLHNLLKMFHELGYRYHIQEAFTRKRPFVDRKCLVGMDLQLNLFFIKQK
jgi:FkbM family methyltransferase